MRLQPRGGGRGDRGGHGVEGVERVQDTRRRDAHYAQARVRGVGADVGDVLLFDGAAVQQLAPDRLRGRGDAVTAADVRRLDISP